MADHTVVDAFDRQVQYADFYPDWGDQFRLSPVRELGEARFVLKRLRLEVWRCLQRFEKQGMSVQSIQSYDYEADKYLKWEIIYRQIGDHSTENVEDVSQKSWITLPIEDSLYLNWALKQRLLDPAAFMRIPITDWDQKLTRPATDFLPFFYTAKELPDDFSPLALADVRAEGIRQNLLSLWYAFQGEQTQFIEVIAMTQDIAVSYMRNGGEAVETLPRYEYPWLYQHLRDSPQHGDWFVKVLNQEAPDSDKDFPFDWQISYVALPI